MNYTPKFQLFELAQHTTTGKLFVVTEIHYTSVKNWFGKVTNYQFEYNGIAEDKLKLVLSAFDAWEKGVLSDPKLFSPK